jgi:hypothetical protein
VLAAGVLIGSLHRPPPSRPDILAASPSVGRTPAAQPAGTASSVPQYLPPGSDPPSTLPNGTSSAPLLTMGQPSGDGYTVFVVHGSGFTPRTRVRVALDGVGVSPDRPFTDDKGTFNYAIDQGRVAAGPPPPSSSTRRRPR